MNRRRQKNSTVIEGSFDNEALKSTAETTLTVSSISKTIEVLSGRMADLITRVDKLQQICDQVTDYTLLKPSTIYSHIAIV